MKKGRWRNAAVLCPYYKYQGNANRQKTMQTISCQGVEPESNIHQTFRAPARREYEETYCRNNYEDCWICSAHLKAAGEN